MSLNLNFNSPLPTDIKQTFAPFVSANSPYSVQNTVKTAQPADAQKPHKSHKKLIVLSSLGGTLLTISGIALLLVNGNFTKLLQKGNKLFEKVDNKIFDMSCNNKLLRTFIKKSSAHKGKISKVLGRTKSLINTTTIKDSFMQKFLYPKLGIEKYTNKITEVYEKITINVTKDKWHTAQKAGEDFIDCISKLGIDVDPDLLNGFETKLDSAVKGFRTVRFPQVQKDQENLRSTVENILYDKNVPNKERLQNVSSGFLPEKLMEDKKATYISKLMDVKGGLSNNLHDNAKKVNVHLSELKKHIDSKDIDTRQALRNVDAALKRYEKSSKDKLARQHLLSVLEELSETVQKQEKYKQSPKKIQEIMDNAKNVILIDKDGENMGAVEQILKNIGENKKYGYGSPEYIKVKKQSKHFTKKLNNAVESESDKMYDKLRDLKLGMGPADIVNYCLTLGAIGFAVGTAPTKQERVSAGLEKGIPGIGALATAILLVTKQANAPKALFAAAISGFTLNKIGTSVNEKYLKATKQKEAPKDDVLF